MSEPGAAATGMAPDRPRLNVPAFASPTTTRYLAFLAALLSAGIFVGSWVYNQTQGRHWVAVVIRCAGQMQPATALPPLEADLARVAQEARCRGAVESRRAVFALAGAGVVGAGALGVVYLAPVVVRRRRRLRAMGAPLRGASDRLAVLAGDAGVRRPPPLERGAAGQRDAFSYGAPGRPRVVLPPAVAVRWQDRQLFDPLVRHELAHVRHRDVALAWLARSVWYALTPLLALPVVVALLSSDRSILFDFLWRAVLLGLTVVLVSAALLRSREHDADLRAAQMAGETASLAALLGRMPHHARRNRLRQVVARHPTPEQRIQVLRCPERATAVTFVDGFSSAFLAGLLFPLAAGFLAVMFTGSGRTDLGDSVAALVAGPLLGGSVGLGLWRGAMAGRFTGTGARVAPVVAGVAAGLVLGQVVSLAGTGSGSAGGFNHPAWLAVSAVLGAGATTLSAGVAQLWADAAPHLGRRLAVTAAVVINGLIFASALWIATTLQFALDNGGLTLGRAWLVTLLPSAGLISATVVVLAVSAGWALWPRPGRTTAPAWMIERGKPPDWPPRGLRPWQWALAAVMSGIIAEGSLAAMHFIEGPPTTLASHAQRYYLDIWVIAAAGAACTAALCLLDKARGAGVACLAAPLATMTAVAGFLVMNTTFGGTIDMGYVLDVGRTCLALGLPLWLIAALAGLIPPASRPPEHPDAARMHPTRLALPLLLPAMCAAVISALLVTGADTIVGPPATLLLSGPASSPGFSTARLDGLRYMYTTAPTIEAAYSHVQRSVAAASAATTTGRAAQLLRTSVLPQLRQILQDAEAIRPGTTQLTDIHRACLAAFRDAIAEYSLFAQALQTGDTRAFTRAKLIQREANSEWTRWQVGLLRLKLGNGIPITP